MARLWKCTLSFNIYVVADNVDDATQTAVDHAEEEFGNRDGDDLVDSVCEVTEKRRLDHAWKDGIPYVTDDLDVEDMTCSEFHMTCSEFLERAAEEAAEKARKADLPGQQRLFEGA